MISQTEYLRRKIMAFLKVKNLEPCDRSSELVEIDQTTQESICGAINQALLGLLTRPETQVSFAKSPDGVDVFSFKLDLGNNNQIIQIPT
jgi:hypothetical protein